MIASRLVSASALALLSLVACTSAPPPSAPLHLTLLAFNDFHGQLSSPSEGAGGAAWLAGTIAQLRARNPLTVVVAAGDLIGASPMSSAMFHDEPSIEALNLAGLELSSVGNHEFDHGLPELQRMQNGGCASDEASCHHHRFAGARFQYLAANVTDAATGEPAFPASAIRTFELGGGRTLKVGFIGAVVHTVPQLVVPAMVKTLAFSDEATAINAAVPALRAPGAEVIVVLIHEGGGTSAAAFDDTTCPNFNGAILPIMDRLDPAIDAVVSGHTHRTYICRRNGRLVTSAGSQGRVITDIELTLDSVSHRLIDSAATQVAVTSRSATSVKNEDVQALVDATLKDAAPLSERVIAKITEDITRRPTLAGESALGDLVADAHLAATQAPDAGGAQIALMNSSGIRVDLRAETGGITYGDVRDVHPFGNSLITVTLTGAQLRALLEQQWTGSRSMLQVSSGFTYEWSADRAPGSRVDAASLRLNGTPIEPAASYRIVANEFLAGGGDGYTVLAAGTDRVRGILDSEALEKYAAAHSPLSAPPTGRIRRAP